MLEAVYAQLRYAASLLLARPLHLPSLHRMIDAVQAGHAEFGPLTSEAQMLIGGPSLDTDTQRHIQLTRFRVQAKRAARDTAFYATLFNRLGIDPKRLTLDEVAQLPLTLKSDLRDNAAGVIRRGYSPTLRTTTTGTTGRSTSMFFTRHEMECYSALAALTYLLHNSVTPADVVQVSTSSRGLLGNGVFLAACQRIGALVQQTGIVEPEAALSLLAQRDTIPGKKAQPSVLLTYPSYLGRLVETAQQLGYTPADFGLERILIGGEIVTAGLRRRCRVLFGDVKIEESYGITEAWPLGGRVCEQGHLHFDPTHGLVEVIDPATGQSAQPGQIGVLVLTPFAPFRESVVLLRYNSEDLVQTLAASCACSLRNLPATSNVLGKLRLSVRHPAGWTTPRHVLEALEAVDELPLPARCGFYAQNGGVAVEVVALNNSPKLRRQIEDALQAEGVPLTALRLISNPAQLNHPLPLRGDLCERSFGDPVVHPRLPDDWRSWRTPAVDLKVHWEHTGIPDAALG